MPKKLIKMAAKFTLKLVIFSSFLVKLKIYLLNLKDILRPTYFAGFDLTKIASKLVFEGSNLYG